MQDEALVLLQVVELQFELLHLDGDHELHRIAEFLLLQVRELTGTNYCVVLQLQRVVDGDFAEEGDTILDLVIIS